MNYTNEKRYSLKQIVILLTIAFSLVSIISYAAVTIPNTFTSGTTISSSQVNDNFTALKTAVDANSIDISALKTVHTGTASVGAMVGVTLNSTVATYQCGGGPGTYGRCAANTLTNDYLAAPIQLPNGATITGISYTCYDNDATYDSVARLWYFGDNAYGEVGAATTSGTSTSNQKVFRTGLNHIVDNSSNAYTVYMSINTSAVGYIVPIKFTVTYTYML